jgi:hypothetical protein
LPTHVLPIDSFLWRKKTKGNSGKNIHSKNIYDTWAYSNLDIFDYLSSYALQGQNRFYSIIDALEKPFLQNQKIVAI